MDNNFIRFWGVRGSHPTPDKDKMKYGGETSCVEIRYNNELFIFDMGSGLRNLGDNILKNKSTPKNINIFLSHYHWDHIVGFLSFKPLFDNSFTFNIYGSNKSTKIEKVANKLLDPSVWPVSMDMLNAKVNFYNLDNKKLKLNNSINVDYVNHPHPNGATSYKLNLPNLTILYTTDCEHENNTLNNNVLEIAKNADIMIHDSHFTNEDLVNHKGWGHSSWGNAINVAKESNVKKVILFHFNPEYNDDIVSQMEKDAKKQFKNVVAAKQNMKIFI